MYSFLYRWPIRGHKVQGLAHAPRSDDSYEAVTCTGAIACIWSIQTVAMSQALTVAVLKGASMWKAPRPLRSSRNGGKQRND